jgi:hypothetical protein
MRPFDHIASGFAGIATATQQLQVAERVRAAIGERNYVIDLKAFVAFATTSADASLPIMQHSDVVGRNTTANSQYSRSPVLRTDPTKEPQSLWISRFPPQAIRSYFIRILARPSLCLSTMPNRALGAALTRPLGFEAGARPQILGMVGLEAFKARTAFGVSLARSALATFATALVMGAARAMRRNPR